jgi:2-oxo-4-hydroxy-4-carboxy-5-ureidoimidazoline decarboxylase
MPTDDQTDLFGALLSCTPSRRWVAAVLEHGPFADGDELMAAANEAWNMLSSRELPPLLAEYLPLSSPPDNPFAATEHAAMVAEFPELWPDLVELEVRYQDRFGFAAVIAVEGLALPNVIAQLRTRLGHDRDSELEVARDELATIGRKRLCAVIASGRISGVGPFETSGSHPCVSS